MQRTINGNRLDHRFASPSESGSGTTIGQFILLRNLQDCFQCSPRYKRQFGDEDAKLSMLLLSVHAYKTPLQAGDIYGYGTSGPSPNVSLQRSLGSWEVGDAMRLRQESLARTRHKETDSQHACYMSRCALFANTTTPIGCSIDPCSNTTRSCPHHEEHAQMHVASA